MMLHGSPAYLSYSIQIDTLHSSPPLPSPGALPTGHVEPVLRGHVSVVDHLMFPCGVQLLFVSPLETLYFLSCFGKLMQVTCFVNTCVPVQAAQLKEAMRWVTSFCKLNSTVSLRHSSERFSLSVVNPKFHQGQSKQRKILRANEN